MLYYFFASLYNSVIITHLIPSCMRQRHAKRDIEQSIKSIGQSKKGYIRREREKADISTFQYFIFSGLACKWSICLNNMHDTQLNILLLLACMSVSSNIFVKKFCYKISKSINFYKIENILSKWYFIESNRSEIRLVKLLASKNREGIEIKLLFAPALSIRHLGSNNNLIHTISTVYVYLSCVYIHVRTHRRINNNGKQKRGEHCYRISIVAQRRITCISSRRYLSSR